MAISARKMEYVLMHLQPGVVDASIAPDRRADQRQTQRHEVNQPVVVSVLGTSGETFHGEIRNVSEGGTELLLDQPVPYGSLVTIDYDDNRLLGEVVYCQREEANWLVGVRVEHALLGLATLASLGECN